MGGIKIVEGLLVASIITACFGTPMTAASFDTFDGSPVLLLEPVKDSVSLTRTMTDQGGVLVVIDLNNDGVVSLTNKENGVQFDLNRDGVKEQLPWLADDKDGWLVTVGLDMTVHDGFYLFGNHSMQDNEIKPGETRNGYRSLRLFDDNKDGVINVQDAIYNQLGVWTDKNRNGVSEHGEIVMLRDAGIESISYKYKESRRKDEHGNEFRYRSDIRFIDGREGFSFDVILTRQ